MVVSCPNVQHPNWWLKQTNFDWRWQNTRNVTDIAPALSSLWTSISSLSPKPNKKTHKLRHPQGHWKPTPQTKNDPIWTRQNNACVMRFAPKTFRIAQIGVGSMWEAKEVFVASIQMAKWKNSETRKNSCGIWVGFICLLPPIHYLEPHGHLFTQKNLCFHFGSYHEILFNWYFFAGKRHEHSMTLHILHQKNESRESPRFFGKLISTLDLTYPIYGRNPRYIVGNKKTTATDRVINSISETSCRFFLMRAQKKNLFPFRAQKALIEPTLS